MKEHVSCEGTWKRETKMETDEKMETTKFCSFGEFPIIIEMRKVETETKMETVKR